MPTQSSIGEINRASLHKPFTNKKMPATMKLKDKSGATKKAPKK